MPSSSRLWLKISAFIAFVLFVTAASSPFIKHVKISIIPSHVSNKPSFQAPKENVWSDLSQSEANSIVNFLLSSSALNLTDTAKATRFVAQPHLYFMRKYSMHLSDDNAILLVELLQSNKSDVLSYLDGSSRPPARWARAVIQQGVTDEPRTVNYMVGDHASLDEFVLIVFRLVLCRLTDRLS